VKDQPTSNSDIAFDGNRLHIVLVEPRIPQNTGNIARLCAASGAVLHLIHPLGFQITDRHLRRAGINCWDSVDICEWDAIEPLETGALERGAGWHLFSTRGAVSYHTVPFRRGDYLVLGQETGGLSQEYIDRHPGRTLLIPMPGAGVRSLNLSTSAGIVLYEAMRQTGMLTELSGGSVHAGDTP
jgi:tRNA (cytidine/uridine-2'-O-)-methyltransferase